MALNQELSKPKAKGASAKPRYSGQLAHAKPRKKISSLLASRYTIMFIPHNAKQPFHFHINLFLLGLFSLGFLVVVFGLFFLSDAYSKAQESNTSQTVSLTKTQANLDSVLDEVKELMKRFQVFNGTLGKTLKELEVDTLSEQGLTQQQSNNKLLNIQDLSGTTSRELLDVKNLNSSLSAAIQPLSQIGDVIRAQKGILEDIPVFWPVGGHQGSVTLHFGPTIHPFLYTWYIHKGLDIAGGIGLPIVAAANGKVIESRYDPNGYGYFIILEHKYGFRTRYAHMSALLVEVGATVKQGQRIGSLGSTGFSTGPHVHFELILGTQVLDPWPFLELK